MAKKSGLGDNIFVHGYDLSGDVGAVDKISGSKKVTDITGINSSAVERLALQGDGEISFSAWFNSAADQEHAALKGLPTGDRQVTYCPGTTAGDTASMLTAKQIN